MNYPKPGPKKRSIRKKNATIRLHNLTIPKRKDCRWCNVETGTECFRHAEDPELKFLDGGGIMGGKINDNLTVWGCYNCDLEMSERPIQKRKEVGFDFRERYLEWQNKWRLGIIRTHLMDN